MVLAMSTCSPEAHVDQATTDLAIPSPGSPGSALPRLYQAETALTVVPPGDSPVHPEGSVLVSWGQRDQHYVSFTPLTSLGNSNSTTGIDLNNDALPVPPGDLDSQKGFVNSIPGNLRNIKPTPSIVLMHSDSDHDTLRLVSPIHHSWEGLSPEDNQGIVVTAFQVSKSDDSVTTLSVMDLNASSGVFADCIVYPQFIQMPSGKASVLTWHETDSRSNPVKIWQKAMAFGDSLNVHSEIVDVNEAEINIGGSTGLLPMSWSTEGYAHHASCANLTKLLLDGTSTPVYDRNGHQKRECGTGDYRYGAFLDSDESTWAKFVVGWSEPDPSVPVPLGTMEARMNIVKVTESAQAR